jgi:hypothetical protein
MSKGPIGILFASSSLFFLLCITIPMTNPSAITPTRHSIFLFLFLSALNGYNHQF